MKLCTEATGTFAIEAIRSFAGQEVGEAWSGRILARARRRRGGEDSGAHHGPVL